MKIQSIQAKEILDSRGIPTIQTELVLQDGSRGVASVPSGSSTGKHEAHEKRDEDMARQNGMGVLKAIDKIHNDISKALIGPDIVDQEQVDNTLIQIDGSPDKSNLGANSILSVSIAFVKAYARAQGLEPYQYLKKITEIKEDKIPSLNILLIEGGKHGKWGSDIQEYMITPAGDVEKSLNTSKKILEELSKLFDHKKYEKSLGMEGGFTSPQIKSNREPLELIITAGENAGFIPGEDFSLSLDVAASEFITKERVALNSEKRTITKDKWIEEVLSMLKEFPIRYLEDPLSEDDWDGWSKLKENLGENIQLVGDDLTVTNPERIQNAIDKKAMNSVIIKPNQIGTVTETLKSINLSETNNIKTVISHRGGETEDTFVSDLVAGTLSNQTKFGAQTQKERVVKYERLKEIYC